MASFAGLILLLGCSNARPPRPVQGGSRDVVPNAELVATRQTNLYDALRQVRPFWFTADNRLSGRGEAGISVYLDEQPIGGVAQLRRLPIQTAVRILYMDPTEAQLRFGQSNGLRAAILVFTARH